jgi:hypothetical protein
MCKFGNIAGQIRVRLLDFLVEKSMESNNGLLQP